MKGDEIDFSEVIKNVNLERDVNWDTNNDILRHSLNYFKENKRNWIDIMILGRTMIKISMNKALLELRSFDDSNEDINGLKKLFIGWSKRNEEDTRENMNCLLVLSSLLGRVPNEINVNLIESNMFSVNLKRRFTILAKNGFRCYYCGRMPPEVRLELDHYHPLSRGGKDRFENLVPACFDCNSGKRARIIKEIGEN